mmetsp:Transcript_71251/g.154847  ORF Transcript_71251/g.154847 Transcript_71251/m.154847 type:complete len:171 (-) Transcript_71251:66-578(-)
MPPSMDQVDEELADPDAVPGRVDRKIVQYEDFLERVLKAELKRSLDECRQDAALLDQCRELRSNIDLLIQGNVTELETMVEVGCQFYAKAFVPDTKRLFVDVGLGFRLEMPLADARDFLDEKEACLLGGLELRKRRTAQIKADIHEALHLLDLMMDLRSGGTPWLQRPDE